MHTEVILTKLIVYEYIYIYTLCFKQLYQFCFCNNLFNREPISIIFGKKNVAKGICNMQSLAGFLLTVQISYS